MPRYLLVDFSEILCFRWQKMYRIICGLWLFVSEIRTRSPEIQSKQSSPHTNILSRTNVKRVGNCWLVRNYTHIVYAERTKSYVRRALTHDSKSSQKETWANYKYRRFLTNKFEWNDRRLDQVVIRKAVFLPTESDKQLSQGVVDPIVYSVKSFRGHASSGIKS